MPGIAFEQLAKDRDGAIIVANRIASQSKIVGSRDLVRLGCQTFLERSLRLAVLGLQVIYCPNCICQARIVRMLLQKSLEKRQCVGQMASANIGQSLKRRRKNRYQVATLQPWTTQKVHRRQDFSPDRPCQTRTVLGDPPALASWRPPDTPMPSHCCRDDRQSERESGSRQCSRVPATKRVVHSSLIRREAPGSEKHCQV
jgi:hypothetical protein